MINNFEFHTKIVGSSFRPAGQELLKSLQTGEELKLEAEIGNEFDENAIKVLVDNEHIGYIPRETAAKIRQDVLQNNVSCVVSEVTGGVPGRENVGCNIKLTVTREEIKNDN